MKQRLGVASALMGDPELIVLDEPTNGLDPAGMADMRALIVDLARGGQTVLLSSHLLAEVQEICDRVGVINNGRLLRESTVAELRGGCVAARSARRPIDRALAVAMRLAGDDGVRVDGERTARSTSRRTAHPDAGPRAGRGRRRRARGRPRRTDPGRGLLRDDPHPRHELAETEARVDEPAPHPSTSRRRTRAELLRLRKWPAVWVTRRCLAGAERDVRLPVQLPVLRDRRQQLLQRGRDRGRACWPR